MRRIGCAGLVLMPALLLPAAPAQAAVPVHVQLGVEASMWTWRQNVPGVEPSNVPTGDLPVQFDGRPNAAPAKATYLKLGLDLLPAGATAEALTVVLPLDPASSQDASKAPAVACALKGPFAPGAGVDPSTAPAENCTQAVPGVLDAAKKVLSFDLTKLAADWLSGTNHGFVVRADPAAAVPGVLPFQLSLQGPTAIEGDLLAVLPSTEPPAPVVDPVVPQLPPPAPPVYAAPLPRVIAPDPVAQPPAVVPVLPSPRPAAPAVAVGMRTPLDLADRRASASAFALAAALGVVLLALMGWSLGSACNPAALARRERHRLDRLRPAPALSQARQIRQGRKPAASAASTVT